MANIYVFADGKYDHSRWLTLTLCDSERVLFELSDLCQPGRVSAVNEVGLEPVVVRSALRNGAIQMTTESGYFLMRRVGDEVLIEFRSHDDGASCRVSLLYDDLALALDAGSQGNPATAL